MNVSDDLKRFFGEYLSQTHDKDWERVKSLFRPGDSVSGDLLHVTPLVFSLILAWASPRC